MLLGATLEYDTQEEGQMNVSRDDHDRIVQECLTQVNHRANNLLSVIHGIIRMTSATDIEAYKRSIEGRISALAQAHSLLTASNWSHIPLRDIINGELINFIDIGSSRLCVGGVELELPAARAQNAAMIMHELAMNAAQHGALRTNTGTVTVKWKASPKGVYYHWHENGQTDCIEPEHLGTGLILVKRIANSTRATVKISWPQTGIHVDFFQPYDKVQSRESIPEA